MSEFIKHEDPHVVAGTSQNQLDNNFVKGYNDLRVLEYLNLEIPKRKNLPKILINNKAHANICNFPLSDPSYKHILHTHSVTVTGMMLMDLIINLSENLNKNDKELKGLITSEPQDVSTILEQLNSVEKSFSELKERVEKTLYKADKFPSKKDIRELLQIPKNIEEKTEKEIREIKLEISDF